MWTEELKTLGAKKPKYATAFSEEIAIDAPIERAWEVLADLASIHTWDPDVKSSRLTTHHGEGVGAARHSTLLRGRRHLDEVVVDWEPLKRITMRITATNLALEAADIRFMLRGTTNGVIVSVSPAYTVRFGILGKILNRLVIGPRYRRRVASLLRGLKTHIEDPVSHSVPTA
jgi:uncharacterized protein YndB with AHSA1/START domain